MRTSLLVETLRGDRPVLAAELRPPRAELDAAAGMNAWIDTYHAVRSLSRQATFVFVTDSAVGAREADGERWPGAARREVLDLHDESANVSERTEYLVIPVIQKAAGLDTSVQADRS